MLPSGLAGQLSEVVCHSPGSYVENWREPLLKLLVAPKVRRAHFFLQIAVQDMWQTTPLKI